MHGAGVTLMSSNMRDAITRIFIIIGYSFHFSIFLQGNKFLSIYIYVAAVVPKMTPYALFFQVSVVLRLLNFCVT